MSQSLLAQHQLRIDGILLRKNNDRTFVGKTDVNYKRKGWHVVLITVIIKKKRWFGLKKFKILMKLFMFNYLRSLWKK